MPSDHANSPFSRENAGSQDRDQDLDIPASRHSNERDQHTHLPSAEYCLFQRGCPSGKLAPNQRNSPDSMDVADPKAWVPSLDGYGCHHPREDGGTHQSLPGEATHFLLRGQLSEKLRAALDAPCLFYPGAGRDVDPALLFTGTGVVSTVVYADYVLDDMFAAEQVFRRYEDGRLSSCEDTQRFCCPSRTLRDSGVLTPGDFGFDSPHDFYPYASTWGSYRGENLGPDAVIGRWALFELEGIPSNPVLFLYFCTEAIQTYLNLWGIRGTAPLAVVVQNHSKGLFWTRLDGDCLLYAASVRLPEYIYVGDIGSTPWPGYRQVSRDRTDHYSLHHSRRALFESKSHFGINLDSPMHFWDGSSPRVESRTYPEFKGFKLAAPRHERRQPACE
jgi:hypothetical protein